MRDNKSNKVNITKTKDKPKAFASIRGTLAVATASLLGSIGHATIAHAEDNWELDTSILYYAETDRVSLFEPIIRAPKRSW